MASVASSLKCKSSSVALWLDDIENVEPAATGIVKCSRKRRRDDNHQHLASLPKCRRAPMNDMSTGTPHTPVHRRSTRRRKEPPPKTFQSYDDDNEEPTPRPSSPGVLTRAPNLEPTESTASEASSRSCTHSSPSRSSVSRRFRASSPRKIATPAATAQQILYQRYIPSQEKRIQIVAQEMIKNIAKYAKGRGVISESAHAVIQARDTEDDFADANFEHDRERLGECPTLDHADLLVGDTIRCHEMHESEAAWNCESHHPIGKTACRMSAHHKSIHWQNLTTADIDSSTLLPRYINGLSVQATRIDFAVTLTPSPRLMQAYPLLSPLPDTSTMSWNPTSFAPTMHMPIAILVETKKRGGDSQNAEFQLGVWASAMFARLQLLLSDSGHVGTQPLPIPLLIADGSRWEFSVATIEKSGAMTIWKTGGIGDACTRLGVYQIIAVIQYLMEWTEQTFRPWFERYCCPHTSTI